MRAMRKAPKVNFALCLLEFHVSPSVAVRRHIASAATPAKRACVWRRERARACAYAEGAKTCKGIRRIPVVCGALSLCLSLRATTCEESAAK